MRYLKWTMMLLGLVAGLASCRDREPDMTLVQGTWYQDYYIKGVHSYDAWNITVVKDDGPSFVELEYSAFLEELLRIEYKDGTIIFNLSQHSHLPYNTVLNATVHTNVLEDLNLQKAATATLVGDFQSQIHGINVWMAEGSSCKGGSFTGAAVLSIIEGSQMVDFNFDGSTCFVLVDNAVFKGTLTASDELEISLPAEGRLTTYGGSARVVGAVVNNHSSLNILETEVEQMEIKSKASEAFVNVNQYIGGSLNDTSTLYYQPHPGLELNVNFDETSHLSPLNSKF